MRTSELLTQLRQSGVKLWVEGAELKVSAPKGVITPELRDQLVQKKGELLNLLAPADNAALDRIPRADRDQPLVLSFTQQRLWFLDQMEPGVITYNMWVAVTLVGPLDVQAFERSLSEMVRRHEVLRTTFRTVDGVPSQVISPRHELELEFLGGRAADLDDEGIEKILLDRLERPFDLETGPLIRATLIRRKETENVLIMVVHHIVFDGLSISLFFRELSPIYAAFAAGKPSPLGEVEVQYADYAAWQRRLLEGDGLARRMAYWKEVLAGDLPILELPIDKVRPAVQTFVGEVESRWVAEEIPAAIDALAQRLGSTPFLVLLAAYQVLLTRITGQEDVLIGTAMANRTRPEVQDLLGYFVNTLVVRTDLSGDPTFAELLVRAREVFFGAVEHQDMPFERLVDEIQPERNLSYSPLFQTLIVLDQDTGDERAIGDIEARPFVMDNHVSRTDLVIHGYRGRDEKGREGRLKIGFEYNTDLFLESTIVRLLKSYETLLSAVIADPEARISELSILTSEERSQVVSGWNDTAAEFPAKPIHARFEEQTDRTPDATAVLFPDPADSGGDLALTYRELDAASNRLARHLVAQGVAARTLVGLALDRSAEMIVAQLAIQKAGAAYVPLDPTYPADRLAHMVEDSGLTACVTTSELVGLLPAGIDAIELDRLVDELASLDSARLELEVAATDRMYVIYTSGSTGRPKGVELEHRSVSNFLSSMAREPGFCAGESLLAVTTLSFDISVLETMLPLMVGGTVIVAPREAVGDGQALIDLVERLRPDAMQATPATWRMMLLSGWEGSDHLRAFCGGEALPRELADDVLPRAQELWNLYGPTETTIWSAVKRVEAGAEPITIGHPIACTQMYVLDRNNQPVPIGVPGELFIGGDGLARGYLERPELTEERFVPDPFAGDGARMYRTGDKARWLATGELECLGRIDTQVKLRGFRIELGEIESVLSEVEGVDQCVCVIREDTPGDQRLTAYHVGPDSSGVETGVLRDAAQAKLPAYMVPAAFVALEELPLTPNGKVDRKALLALEAAQTVSVASEIVEPRTDVERGIAGVWCEVLGVDRVSVNTNFFDLGGHSLLLAQVRSKLQDALGAKLTIIELFQYPTVSALATRIDSRDTKESSSEPAERSRSLAAGREALMRRRRR